MATMHVLTLARMLPSNQPVMVKIRYELDLDEFLIENIDENKETTSNHVGLEADLIDLLYSIGHGPQFIDLVEYDQMPGQPFPRGRVFGTFTGCVPGEDLDEIRDQLSPEDLWTIKVQLARILNEMGKAKRVINEEHLSFLRYDREHKKLYLADLSHWTYEDIIHEITINSAFVMAFGLWKYLVSEDKLPAH